MSKRLKKLLTVMIIIFEFLVACLIIATLGLIFSDSITDDDPLITIVKMVAVWLFMLFPMLVCFKGLRIKEKEENNVNISIRSKQTTKILLQIVFVVYLGLPAIFGVGVLLLTLLGAAPGFIGLGDKSSGISVGLIFFSDEIINNVGVMVITALIACGLVWFVFWLFTTVLQIIRKDF